MLCNLSNIVSFLFDEFDHLFICDSVASKISNNIIRNVLFRQRKNFFFVDQLNIPGIYNFFQVLYDNLLLFYQAIFCHHNGEKCIVN
jgi:hypothetical protein